MGCLGARTRMHTSSQSMGFGVQKSDSTEARGILLRFTLVELPSCVLLFIVFFSQRLRNQHTEPKQEHTSTDQHEGGRRMKGASLLPWWCRLLLVSFCASHPLPNLTTPSIPAFSCRSAALLPRVIRQLHLHRGSLFSPLSRWPYLCCGWRRRPALFFFCLDLVCVILDYVIRTHLLSPSPPRPGAGSLLSHLHSRSRLDFVSAVIIIIFY